MMFLNSCNQDAIKKLNLDKDNYEEVNNNEAPSLVKDLKRGKLDKKPALVNIEEKDKVDSVSSLIRDGKYKEIEDNIRELPIFENIYSERDDLLLAILEKIAKESDYSIKRNEIDSLLKVLVDKYQSRGAYVIKDSELGIRSPHLQFIFDNFKNRNILDAFSGIKEQIIRYTASHDVIHSSKDESIDGIKEYHQAIIEQKIHDQVNQLELFGMPNDRLKQELEYISNLILASAAYQDRGNVGKIAIIENHLFGSFKPLLRFMFMLENHEDLYKIYSHITSDIELDTDKENSWYDKSYIIAKHLRYTLESIDGIDANIINNSQINAEGFMQKFFEDQSSPIYEVTSSRTVSSETLNEYEENKVEDSVQISDEILYIESAIKHIEKKIENLGNKNIKTLISRIVKSRSRSNSIDNKASAEDFVEKIMSKKVKASTIETNDKGILKLIKSSLESNLERLSKLKRENFTIKRASEGHVYPKIVAYDQLPGEDNPTTMV